MALDSYRAYRCSAIIDRDRLSVLEVELDMAYSALFPLFPQGFYGFNEADVDAGGHVTKQTCRWQHGA